MSSAPTFNTLIDETLADQALLAQFGDLVRQDHHHTAGLLRHIDLIDRRQLWAKQGHPSLFDFLVARHHMSESSAGKRIGAARTARRFPILFDMVARGEIHLSGIHRLKAHLTPENHERVLGQAKHKTIRQIEQLVAHLAPQPDAPFRLRALPIQTPAAPKPAPPAVMPAAPAVMPAAPAVMPAAPAVMLAAPAVMPGPPPRRAPDPLPLAPGRYKLQVTLGEESYQRLKQLEDLLAHQLPNGDPAAIIERALDALLTQVQKRKAAVTDKPRATRPAVTTPRTRAIPAAIRRDVWTRDQGRCAFVGSDGHRCNETRRLEFAHLKPWARGGRHSAVNVALRCAAHNALEAERDFGPEFMARKRKRE